LFASGLLALLAGQALAAEVKPRPKGDLEELVEGQGKGTRFRLVSAAAPEQAIGATFYWRTFLGTVSAETAPARFRLGDVEVIAPQLNKDKLDSTQTSYTYPTEGAAEVEPGKHVLEPGGMTIEFRGGVPASQHSAVRIAGNEVRLLCAPVRFETVDERGVPVTASVRLLGQRGPLLREEAQFSVLTLWLPVGGQYQTSFGTVVLTASGKVDAQDSRLASGVAITEAGLRRTVPAKPEQRAAATASETVTLRVGTGSVEVFVPAVVSPGTRLALAVSRQRYESAAGGKPAAGQFTCTLDDAGADPLPVEAASAPDEAQRAAAAKALATEPEDLAWISAVLPEGMLGPVTLRIKVGNSNPVAATVLIAELAKLHLVPHRWRTVFADTETASYQLFIPRGTAAGEAQVMVQAEGDKSPAMALGRVTLPSVEGRPYDSRLFTVNMADLPIGSYRLWVQARSQRSGSIPLRVVSWLHRSPFLAQSMSGCTECWPTSEKGLDMLEKAGLEMLSATGFDSLLDTRMPALDSTLSARLARSGELPAELAVRATSNDRLLTRLLRRHLRLIDLTVCRAPGLYLEGLSYHHSYPPSVDRMIRRMQVFTQQTADYASFWGVNYSWFPALFGYAESGVPTDAHVADRNRVLGERVRAAGFEPLAPAEQQWLTKHGSSRDPKERAEVLRLGRKSLAHWTATHNLGWGEHNALYNRAIREVRPGTVCTLFENAGHNEGKRVRAMFNDMDAQCYESYTDFGDWPMSSAFVVDWSRAQSPGQPVWLTTCWGTSSEGKMKSLFHAFARGLAGGGPPMQATFDLAELARRGTGTQFLSQYGALASGARPDCRVAILARNAGLVFWRGKWDAHAAYYHLTRLGYPPAILSEEEVLPGAIPPAVKVLVLNKDQWPWEPELLRAVRAFVQRGGKILTIGDCAEPLEGAIAVSGQLKHLWELKGFHADSHAEMWREFTQTWRPALSQAMTRTGLSPAARTDPELAIAVAMDAGPVRYVAVIADPLGKHSNEFEPLAALPLSLEGTGWIVRDLVKQKVLPTSVKDGRTETTVDLLTEPTMLLALYPAEPAALTVKTTGTPRLGAPLEFQTEVAGPGAIALGPVPLRYTLTAPAGQISNLPHVGQIANLPNARADLFRAAGDRVVVPLAAHDSPGLWRLTAQELLTGRTATVGIEVAPPATVPPTLQTVAEVHVVQPDHLRAFASRKGEKLIIVEPEQAHLVELAQSLAADLKKAGADVRLWNVRPEEFDTHPVRFYPTAEDQQRLDAIDAGRLIGYRQNLQPFIDKIKRAHDPRRGGYSEIEPPYMVGRDCIVFAGGRLAEGLRAVSPWMASPNVPGKGQGRLVVCFSPFMARRNAVAVVANDSEGLARAAAELAKYFADANPKPTAPVAGSSPLIARSNVKTEVQPIARPYGNYTPARRVVRLMCNRAGEAAVLLRGDKDNLAMVDAKGQCASVFTVDPKLGALGRLSADGRLLWPTLKVEKLHPGWGFPIEISIRWRCITPAAAVVSDLAAYTGPTSPPNYEGGVVLGEDGASAVFGRPGGLLYRFGAGATWKRYDDVPHARTRFELLYPRQPVGAAISPDGRYAVSTMDSRPPFGGMNGPTPRPTACETVLLDLQTGQRLWALRGTDENRSTYAVQTGSAAVARDGAATAIADYDGGVYLVDKAGKVLVQDQLGEPITDRAGRPTPPERVAVRISDAGETAVFAFLRQVMIAHGGRVARVPLERVTSADVSPDGAQVVAGLADGRVMAFDVAGKALWTASPGGVSPLVAAIASGHTLAATGPGDLVRLDNQGKEVGRTRLGEGGPTVRETIQPAATLVRETAGPEYLEPPTLAQARQLLGASQVAAWKPAGTGQKAFGRQFFVLKDRAELASDSAGECLAHVVYRRPAENRSLRIETECADGRETFHLDLLTAEYRVVDLPLRGPKARATIITEGPVEVAEFSLWSLRWPGPNLAYVKPAGFDAPAAKPAGGIDILEELEGKSAGKMRTCRLFWPNTDVDQVRGPWLPAPVEPLQMVDGRRFGNGKLGAWADRFGHFEPIRGGFFTIDFGGECAPKLVALYDRAGRQSEVTANLVLFTPEGDPIRGGSVLAGAVGNDQFWRLLPLGGPTKVRALGVHLLKDPSSAAGLSEVEVY
jgi:outer membrane protein assembly factor BamB